jgi:hypothetical protein
MLIHFTSIEFNSIQINGNEIVYSFLQECFYALYNQSLHRTWLT